MPETCLGRFRETENSNKGREGNHRIYGTTTKDFHSFAPTRLLYDGGFNVIDASLQNQATATTGGLGGGN